MLGRPGKFVNTLCTGQFTMMVLNWVAAARSRRMILAALASIAVLGSHWVAAATALSLAGSPVTSVVAAHYYAFQPSAGNSTGYKPTFAVSNKPSWASFDAGTGRLYGTPVPANVGTYANVVISVTAGSLRASLAAFALKVLPPSNSPPKISGAPAASVFAPGAYSFQPAASDPNGLRIVFGIWNKPAWLSFDVATGRLYGTALAANVGSYSNIVITAYDGYAKASLSTFGITVKAAVSVPPPPPPPTSAATVSWIPPTQNTDGTVLTNLAGYRLYYGTTTTNLDHSVAVANPGLARYVIENLSPTTWYVAMTAYNTGGQESDRTPISSIVLH